ncbi:hypothetical protein B0H13DRAFT_2269906 [Mycena leptocephala]|nr:hypothetical protein B0H13DRAFT_2269906 [Mycena leptocephala]
MPDGPMDVQDLLSWGAVIPERASEAWEYERLHRLCDLADTLGIDALCYVTSWKTGRRGALPASRYSFIHSGAWHDHYPGETRIHLDLTYLISLYDVALAPSLVSRRYGQARRDNRVLGIDARDTPQFARVREIPFNSTLTPSASGIDWRTLFQVIRDRYATRLEVLQSILLEDATPERAFVLVQTALAPYRVSASRRPQGPTPLGRRRFFGCSIQPKLTASERLLLAAAQATSREICRTLVRMWAEGVLALRDSRHCRVPDTEMEGGRGSAHGLAGLGRVGEVPPSVILTAATQESCYLPGAPFSMGEWNTSTPRCIRLFEPYSGVEEEWTPPVTTPFR